MLTVRKALSGSRAAARTAFYAGATAVAARLAKPFGEVEREYGRYAMRDAFELQRAMFDRPEVREALSRSEREDLATLPFFLAAMPFDLARIVSRTRRGVRSGTVVPPDDFPYPDYYLNDFHHQANGNLSLRAALTYEWQIRFLFMGASRLMRQALIDAIPPGRGLDVLDVGCGTAAWLTQARAQGRMHHVTGIDLSPHYLAIARLFRAGEGTFLQMNAEHLDPAWSDRFDLVTCIWLFHEMPPEAIERATAEIARVLRPGGRFLFLEAAQPDDVQLDGRSTVRGISERFRDTMNEPYFRRYQEIDLPALFGRHGLSIERTDRCYVSKLVVARRS